MKTIIKTVSCILVLAVSAAATNHTVKAGGGGNYTTIQACANAATAGDTCTVYSGTYNEAPSLSHSGTGTNGVCTACITFAVNAGDTVTTQPWNVAANYVIIQGFTITDPTFTIGNAGIYIHSGTTGVQILNNILTQVGRAAGGQTSSGYPCISMQDGPSHYTTIKGNTVSWCSALSSQMNVANGNSHIATGIVLLGDHILLHGNDISHVTNGISLGGGSTNVAIIGNKYHDTYIGSVDGTPPNGEHDALGCIEANSCDTHLDFTEAAGGGNNHILWENNSASNIWGTQGAHMWFVSSASATDSYAISRFNKGYQVGSAYLANEAFTSNPYGMTYWKDYNNSYIFSQQQSNGQQALAVCGQNGANGSLLNDLFYNDVNPAGTANAAYYLWGASCLPVNSGHNLGYDSACTAGTLAGSTTGQMATDSGNINADPLLVATDGTSIALQAGSPAIGAGTYLTTASGSGSSSTSLTVADAAYFQDGWGIPGVSADWIRIGSTTTIQISSINHSTNVITLASAVSWNKNDPIYLYKDSSGNVVLNGANPNIGADGASPAAPAGGAGGTSPAAPAGLAAAVN